MLAQTLPLLAAALLFFKYSLAVKVDAYAARRESIRLALTGTPTA